MTDRVTNTAEAVDLNSPDDIALADRMNQGRQQVITELRKVIIGQEEIINQVLLTLFVGGNSLIVGAPGLAKTLLIYTMARVLDLKFSRIQFTPDLMPSDVTGTEVLEEERADVAAGEVDTVAVALTDMQGRLSGKRIDADFFLDDLSCTVGAGTATTSVSTGDGKATKATRSAGVRPSTKRAAAAISAPARYHVR